MITYPNAKINIGLHILRKRSDGFHDLETLFHPIGLRDILEILPAPDLPHSRLTISGLEIEGNTTDNLCLRAYELLKNDFPDLPSVSIHLHKQIPTRAGLGGGSADASFTLNSLNSLFQLGLTQPQLQSYASHLGSDCSFFITSTPSIGTEKGDILTPFPLSLQGYHLLVIVPPLKISTAKAYAHTTPHIPSLSLREILSLSPLDWKNQLNNDFEQSLFPRYPILSDIKSCCYTHGAIYASLSGSGAAMYGLFPTLPPLDPFQQFDHPFLYSEILK